MNSGTGFAGKSKKVVMESGNSKAALLAFAKTIERLVEANLILNDSSAIGYGPRVICPGVEVEEVSIAFQSIRGFKETFREEYNRLKDMNGDKFSKEKVEHPHYYQKNGRECIDVMIEKFGVEAVINFCECNEFKYLWRAGLKEGNSAETDRAKGAWYRRKAEELRNANH